MDRDLNDRIARSSANADRMPRLLAFYEDIIDEDLGIVVGWRTVAWGLAVADGSAVSVPVNGPLAATVWQSVDDAAVGLNAYVDTPDPRPRLADVPTPVRAATATPLRPSDGNAARTACPSDPPERKQGRDRPPGAAVMADEAARDLADGSAT